MRQTNGFARFFHGLISVLLLHSGHKSKPQFFHCFSIVSRVLYAIMVPHRSLNFSIVFPSHQFPSFYSYFTWHHFWSHIRATILPLFFRCFTPLLHHSPSIFPLLFHGFTRHRFPLHSSLPSVFFTVVPPVLLNRPIVYAINLSFHFINFSSVLPWCYSISLSLPLYYLSVSNAYPNARPTIPTVAPYKWFCSFLPWFYFRASTP